jgi:hypothetical protein
MKGPQARRKLIFDWIFRNQGFYPSFADLNMTHSDVISEFLFFQRQFQRVLPMTTFN